MLVHTAQVRGRKIAWDKREVVQHGLNADRIKFDLDAEFRCCDSYQVVLCGPSLESPKRYIPDKDMTVAVPPSLMESTGPVSTCLLGYVGGEVRVVTAQERYPLVVVESGFTGPLDPGEEQPDLWAQLMSAEAARIEAELARESAEKARADAEAKRIAAEKARETASAEAVKAANEAAAKAEQAARQAEDRVTAAIAEVAKAEQARTEAEKARAAAESSRAEAEAARIAAESKRESAEAKRKADSAKAVADASAATSAANAAAGKADAAAQTATDGEASRVAAETARAKAEQARATAEEGRVEAEKGRVVADAERGTRVDASVKKADAATAKATEAAGKADASAAEANTAAARADAAAQALENAAPLYGVRFSGSQSKGERLYASVGKDARPSTAESAGRSDFDGCDPFDFVRVKRKAGPDGRWSDIAVEGTPSWDAPGNADLDVFCRFKNPHFRMVDDGEVDERVVSSAPFKGSHPLVVDADGTVPEHIYIAAYNTSLGSDGRSRSIPGRFVSWGNYATFAKADKLAGASCHSGSSWFEAWKLLLPVIEYADRNVQSAIGDGFSGGRITHGSDKLVEPVESGNTVKIAPAAADAYLVGQAAFVGKNTWNVVGSADIAADERTITAIDPVAGTVTLDGEPFSATTDMYLNNLDYKTGSTDAVLGHTGQAVRDNRHAVKYRGVEGIWGGVNEPIIDIRLKTAVGPEGQKHYETYYCPDPIKARDCTQNAPSADFVNIGLPWPTSAGYIKRAQASEAHPSLVVPAETGASSTTYYCDSYWFDPNFPDDRAPRAGAHWSRGADLGVFCRPGSYVASDGGRIFGARLFT